MNLDRHKSAFSRASLIKAILCLLLAVLVFAVYWQTAAYDFVNYDDHLHIRNNPIVSHGVSAQSLWWAFSSVYGANWCPLAWISHMLDVQLFGMNPGMHHLTSVVVHAVNSVLLFLLLSTMTGSVWRSAAVAGLFAVHPLHVESVAWISERKDVLSTLFWLLTLMGYTWYARKRSPGRYLLVAVLFGMGLMAKPMLVTLPFVLLLMDLWPLKRIDLFAGTVQGSGEKTVPWLEAWVLVREKIPLIALSLISSAMTVYAQSAFGAVNTLQNIPLGKRLGNVLCSYVLYLWKTVWPFDLAVFYPYPDSRNPYLIIACGLGLLVATLLILRNTRRFAYLAVGWLWYLGTLVPVIGIVQVGAQSMADRYTYIPLIGIFIMACWGVADLLKGWRQGRIVAGVLYSAAFAILAAVAWTQAGHWKDSISLFSHALEVTGDNYLAHNNLGTALSDNGRIDESLAQFRMALLIYPAYEKAHDNIAGVLVSQKKYDEAFVHYRESLRLNPGAAKSHYNMGFILNRRGDVAGAVEEYQKALQIDNSYISARNNLGLLLESLGRTREAEMNYLEALQTSPGSIKARMNLVALYSREGRLGEALPLIDRALEDEPENMALILSRAEVLAKAGSHEKAKAAYEKALSIKGDSVGALYGLAVLHAREGSYDKAIASLKRIAGVNPDNPDVYYNLSCMQSRKGDIEGAIASLQTALDKGFKSWDLLRTDEDLKQLRGTAFYQSLMKGRE